MSRILALDYGSKRIGVAISDETKKIAQVLPTIVVKNLRGVLEEIKRLIIEKGVEKILLGLPLALKGYDSAQTIQVRKFATELGKLVPVEMIDERFTTREAARLLREAKLNAKKAKSQVDSMSAFVILQSYLSKFRD